MHSSYSRWVSSRHLHRHSRQHRRRRHLRQQDGPVAVASRVIPVNSVQSVEHLHLRQMAGYAAVVQLIKESSVQNAARRSLQENPYINVINVDGNRKIPRIHLNSALSAVILLMKMTCSNGVQYIGRRAEE